MRKGVRRGQLARILEIPIPTVKYYTALGLFPIQSRTENGQYLYDLDKIRERYSRIQEFKKKRLTIQEIKDRLQMEKLIED